MPKTLQDDGTVVISEKNPQRWQWACPEGHRSWQLLADSIYCHSCYRATADGSWPVLIDTKTGESVDCGDIMIEKTVDLAVSGTQTRRVNCETAPKRNP